MLIDALDFACAGRSLSGVRAVAEFKRLCQGESLAQHGEVAWRVEGRPGGAADVPHLAVQAQGTLQVHCQRCLEPMAQPLQVDNVLRLHARRESLEAADALEANGQGLQEESVLADAPLDVLALVEDELILALPLAPRHAVCPEAASRAPVAPEADSPFAVLGTLKKH